MIDRLVALAATLIAVYLACALVQTRVELQTLQDQDWLEVCGDLEPIDWDLACYSIEMRRGAE